MMFWTDEKIRELKELVKQGESFTIIGRKLHCTRNAAIGKATRLNLEIAKHKRGPLKGFRKKLVPKLEVVKEIPKKKKKFRVRLPKEFHDDKFFEEFMNNRNALTILDIPNSNECKYITGDVKDRTGVWCRKQVVPEKNWCEEHLKLVYAGFPVRRRSR